MGRNVYINLRTKLNLGIILCSLIHTQKILLRFFRSIFRQKSIPLYTTLVHIDIVSRIGSADENKRKTGNEEMAKTYTYWVIVNDDLNRTYTGLSYYKACKMFHQFRLSNDDSIVSVEMGNEQTGRCINSVFWF